MTVSDFESDSLVQKCVVLQDKLASLVSNIQSTSTSEPPEPERKFVQREALMARANSLKKAIGSVIDVTERGK